MADELMTKLIERELVLLDRIDSLDARIEMLSAEIRAARKLLRGKWYMSEDSDLLKAWVDAMNAVDNNGAMK